MNILKKVLAVLGVAFGLLALCYLIFAWAMTLKGFGLSVEAQLITQRILTPLLFVALAALAASCEYFRRVLLQSGIKAGILLRILRLVAVVVLPVVIVYFTMSTPFWSFQSPSCWDRPQFFYGWFLPWRSERAMAAKYMICPFLNLFLWTLYLMVLMGYRQAKHYFVLLWVMLVLFVPYSMFVGIKPVYRGCKPQSKAQSPTAQFWGFYTAHAFRRKVENYKPYNNVRMGMNNKKQNAAHGESAVKNLDSIRLRPHRLSFKTLH